MHVETISSTHPERRRGARQVLVVLHEAERGGASRAMLGATPLLEERGWEFVFWIPTSASTQAELDARGYVCSGEPRLLRYSWSALRMPPGAASRLRSVPGYLRRFRHWVRLQSPALVHANTLITIPEAVAARSTGCPTLLYTHEMLPGGLRGAAAARLA